MLAYYQVSAIPPHFTLTTSLMIKSTQLIAALNSAFATLGGGFTPEKSVLNSIKIGEEAADHTGSGCLAYFCVEESLVMSAYYDAPSLYWAWEEALQDALKPYGLFAERLTSCEFGLYKV